MGFWRKKTRVIVWVLLAVTTLSEVIAYGHAHVNGSKRRADAGERASPSSGVAEYLEQFNAASGFEPQADPKTP